MLDAVELAEYTIGVGVKKVNNDWKKTFLAAILAGLFIGLGYYAYFTSTYIYNGNPTGKSIGALLFPVGIMLVLITGAELFTGNCLVTFGYLDGRYKMKHVLKNWFLVYTGNLVGSLLLAVLITGAGSLDDLRIAYLDYSLLTPKSNLTFIQAFFRGIICNIFVTLSVYVSYASKSMSGKILGMWLPVTIFVIGGFEHSVANMFIFPLGLMNGVELSMKGMLINNLLPVTLGNIAGGALIIPLFYYNIFVNRKKIS